MALCICGHPEEDHEKPSLVDGRKCKAGCDCEDWDPIEDDDDPEAELYDEADDDELED